MPAKPTIVVVDTNCFIRLLFSPLRPLLGSTFGGYKLMTLVELRNEVGPGTEVADKHPWLLDESVQKELDDNCLTFREPKKTAIVKQAKLFRLVGNASLRKFCVGEGLDKIRELSGPDTRALASAQVTGGMLATDEWPLTRVALELSDVERVFTSLDVVHLIEKDSKISREQRINVVASWVKNGENLPKRWPQQYRVNHPGFRGGQLV